MERRHRLLDLKIKTENIIAVIVFIILIASWETAVRVLSVPMYMLPPPSAVLLSFEGQLERLITLHLRATVVEAVLGYTLANLVGFSVALLLSESRILERSLSPYIISLRAIPVVAIAPLLAIWFGLATQRPIILAAAFISFFPMIVNTTTGLKATDPTTLDLMRSLNANRLQVLRYVKIPYATPFIFAALKLSVGLAMIGAVIGEWIGTQAGLGFLILIATNNFDTLLLFRALILLVMVSVFWYSMTSLLERRALRWSEVIE